VLEKVLKTYKGLDPEGLERKAIGTLLRLAFLRGVIYALVVPLLVGADESNYFIDLQAFALRVAPSLGRPLVGEGAGQRPLFEALYLPLYLATSGKTLFFQVIALRLLGVCLGVATIYVIHLIAKRLAPENRFITLGAPLLAAFIPQFTHVYATIGPDIVATLAASVCFLGLVHLLKEGPSVRWGAISAGSLLLALLAKRTGFFLIAVALVLPFVLILTWVPKSEERRLYLAGHAGLLTALLPLGWYVAGFTSLKKSLLILQRGLDLDLVRRTLNILSPTGDLFVTFWVAIGRLAVMLPSQVYLALFVPVFLALAAAAVYLLCDLRRRSKIPAGTAAALVLFWLAVLASVAVVVAKAALVPSTGVAQGRWIYPAIGPLAILLALGWWRIGARRDEPRALLVLAVPAFIFDLFVVRSYVIAHYYQSFPAKLNLASLTFGDSMTWQMGQAIATSRPVVATHPLGYAILFAAYVALFALLCGLLVQLALSRPPPAQGSLSDTSKD